MFSLNKSFIILPISIYCVLNLVLVGATLATEKGYDVEVNKHHNHLIHSKKHHHILHNDEDESVGDWWLWESSNDYAVEVEVDGTSQSFDGEEEAEERRRNLRRETELHEDDNSELPSSEFQSGWTSSAHHKSSSHK